MRDINGNQTFIRRPFRPCKIEDFEENGIKLKTESQKNSYLKTRICPDLSGLEELWKLKNPYAETERISFVIDISKCSSDVRCKSDEEISELLKRIYFNQFQITEHIELSNTSSIGERPVKVFDEVHSQFQLKVDEYRDLNNFVTPNKIEANDSIWSSSFDKHIFTSLSISPKRTPVWIGKLWINE